jgi:hypothetical protein
MQMMIRTPELRWVTSNVNSPGDDGSLLSRSGLLFGSRQRFHPPGH